MAGIFTTNGTISTVAIFFVNARGRTPGWRGVLPHALLVRKRPETTVWDMFNFHPQPTVEPRNCLAYQQCLVLWLILTGFSENKLIMIRQPVILHGKEDEQIITKPFRPTPPHFMRRWVTTFNTWWKDCGCGPKLRKGWSTKQHRADEIGRKPDDERRRHTNQQNGSRRHTTTHDNPRRGATQVGGLHKVLWVTTRAGWARRAAESRGSSKLTKATDSRFLYSGHCQVAQAFDQDVKTFLSGLIPVESIADNILVHSMKADQHQDYLTKFLDRRLEEGITLKRAKTAHCKKEILSYVVRIRLRERWEYERILLRYKD